MATIAEQPHRKPWSMARVIIASSAGTAFEWYDFFIFGSLAPVISKVFFAGLDPTPALIAALGLFAALLVIVATRTSLGEDAFAAWGWRIPFLVSALLLAISVWMRAKLAESPEFCRLREEGEIAKAPLRESFGKWRNLKQVLIA